MEFPPVWVIVEADDFTLAAPRDPGDMGMELLAQVRANGRIMDHFRVALGGNTIIKVNFPAKDIYANQAVPNIQIKWDVWGRDIIIRRNMATSEWEDLTGRLAANEAFAHNIFHGAIPGEDEPGDQNAELLDFLLNLPERGKCGAAVRWAVGIGPDGNMELILQGLPASAATLLGKPTFRG